MDNNNEKRKLKQCPFCGVTNNGQNMIVEIYDEELYKYTYCFNCKSSSYNWNVRHIETLLNAEIEQLKKDNQLLVKQINKIKKGDLL